MKKVKYSEVPKEYRRNYKKEFVEVLKVIGVCTVLTLFIGWMFWMA